MSKIMNLYNLKKVTTLLSILLVLILYTFIKLPYFDYDFTGEHSMKYSAYVEPALHMVENNDFSWFQKKYYADPINNPEGIVDGITQELPQLPLIEWKIAGMLKIFPDLSMEVITRVVMHGIGMYILIFAFLFVKEMTNRTIAFLYALFLATNPIFGLATFVTVYDSVILATLFISLYCLTLYLKNRKEILPLALAGIFAGIGIATKITILLWLLPLVLIIVLYKSPNLITKLFDLFSYALFTAIPYALAKYKISTMEGNITKIIASLVIILVLTNILQRYKQNLINLMESFHRHKILIPILILSAIPVVLVSIQLIYSPIIADEFLTDSRLIFNFEMYAFMARQFVRHIGIPLAIISIAGVVSLFFLKNKDIRILGLSFLFTGFLFLVISSKSIFFHDYYTIFLMAAMLLNAAIFLSLVFKKVNNLQFNALIFAILFFLIIIPRISSTRERFEYQEEKFDEAIEYFIENTQNISFYIDEIQATYFTTYTGRPRVGDLVMLEDETFKQSIRDIGFGQTMDKYNIAYLITFNQEPEYEKYVNLFAEENLKRPSYRRTDLILSTVNPDKYSYFEDIEERELLIEEYDIEEKFVFEKQIGRFRFFTFAD